VVPPMSMQSPFMTRPSRSTNMPRGDRWARGQRAVLRASGAVRPGCGLPLGAG
jgi:hypothetical protein